MTKLSVREYLIKHPNANTLEVMGATGAKKFTVYKIRYLLRKDAANGVVSPSLPKRRGRPPKARLIDLSAQPVFMATSAQSVLHDPVNHPSHYKVGGIETIDFIEAKKLNYNLGNVVKYITRADHKGNRKQDLEKARWYLDREIKALT
jgi:hypothetical protein